MHMICEVLYWFKTVTLLARHPLLCQLLLSATRQGIEAKASPYVASQYWYPEILLLLDVEILFIHHC